MPKHQILQGDCLDVMQRLIAEGAQFDSIVTDPPYHLTSIVKRFGGQNAAPAQFGTDGAYARASRGFMGKEWDGGNIAFRPETWELALRLLKPGGHLLAFSGSRTYHRMACAIEDAGFEIRDQIMWIYGSGFPKSHDVSKGIDKAGPSASVPYAKFAAHYEERRKASGLTHAKICAIGKWYGQVNHGGASANWASGYAVPTAEQWEVLQPLLGLDNLWRGFVREEYEREIIGQRRVQPGVAFSNSGPTEIAITAPATEAARQWQGWGTALKPAHEPICMARKPLDGTVAGNVLAHGTGAINVDRCRVAGSKPDTTRGTSGTGWGMESQGRILDDGKGRWPANIIHDGSEEVVAGFPDSAGGGFPKDINPKNNINWTTAYSLPERINMNDFGSAARFFYSAKADSGDRMGSKHPTVKPIDLMAYLCRLVTQPGGDVLDIFAGSGTTGIAAVSEGFNVTLIEREAEYVEDIKARFRHISGHDTPLFS